MKTYSQILNISQTKVSKSVLLTNYLERAEKLLKPRYEETKKSLLNGNIKPKKTLIGRTIMGSIDSHESYQKN
jgi:hypothetical protein